MPWQPSDAPLHTHKADTPARAKLWAKIANERLAAGDSEASAIAQANAVIAQQGQGGHHLKLV